MIIDKSTIAGAAKSIATAYNSCGYACYVVKDVKEIDDEAAFDALLILYHHLVPPSKVCDGPVKECKGKIIPQAILPVVDLNSVISFTRNLKIIHQHKNSLRHVAILGQWDDRYLRLADQIEATLKRSAIASTKWTSDIILREDMVHGLAKGMGVAIYVGHGVSTGWEGFRGTGKKHFDGSVFKPVHALLQLCCSTGGRRYTQCSFSEYLFLKGKVLSTLCAVNKTLHTDNIRWAVNISFAMSKNIVSVGELIVKSLPGQSVIKKYRLIGDPFAPLQTSPSFIERANKTRVFI
jgi:hypothetical protein